MADLTFDDQERLELCVLFDELGPSAPTLLERWTTHDLAAHIVLRERDLVAAPCLVLPGPFARFAERRQVSLRNRRDFAWLVARIRSGPPPGFFRLGWVQAECFQLFLKIFDNMLIFCCSKIFFPQRVNDFAADYHPAFPDSTAR